MDKLLELLSYFLTVPVFEFNKCLLEIKVMLRDLLIDCQIRWFVAGKFLSYDWLITYQVLWRNKTLHLKFVGFIVFLHDFGWIKFQFFSEVQYIPHNLNLRTKYAHSKSIICSI